MPAMMQGMFPMEVLESNGQVTRRIAKKIDGKIFYSHDPEEFSSYTICPAYYGG